MSLFSRMLPLLVVAGLGLSLAACGTRDRSYYPSQLTTPRDHPAPPKRRPVPPSAFLAEVARDTATPGATGIDTSQPSFATSTASRVPTTIEVQTLEAPRQPEAQPVEQTAQRPVAAPAAEKASLSQRSGGSYRVQAGDTLYAISRRLNVPIRAIIDANGLAAPYSLQVSDTLVIPQPRSHQVARGETVYGISRVYGVDMSELVRQNNISAPYSISTGRLLIIPSGKTAAQQLAGSGGAVAQPIETAAGTAPAPAPAPGASEAAAPTAAATAPVPRRAIAAISKPPPLEGGKFLWPIEGKVLATFGPRKDGQHNDGINILAPRGAPVRAAENGVVAYAGEELRGFGRLLLIKHADGWVTAYAHNDSLLVQRGDKVRRGQPVAKVGSSGSVARPQLHFEVRKGSRAIDPRQLLRPSSISSAG